MLNDAIVSALTPLTDGLLFISESESPIDIFTLDDTSSPDAVKTALAARTGQTAADVEEREPESFFAIIERQADPSDDFMMQQAQRYRELNAFLESHFSKLSFYRVGKKQVHLYIVATDDTNGCVVLHMVSIET